MRILYVTTIGATMGFFKSLINELIAEGHIVDIACNEMESAVPNCYREWGCTIHQINCSRSPLKADNVKAISELSRIVKDNNYDIVHCHTPIASMCTRLACRKIRKLGLKVIYTAHGFHFYKGAPLKNWLLYYPVEKICSYFTDTLITINKEDYDLAKRTMKSKKIEYVPGVGIDVDRFRNVVVDRKAKRQELEIPEDTFLLISVGELNENKNHEVVVKAVGELKDKNIHYAIAGAGHLKEHLLKVAEGVGVQERIHLLGFRSDVNELYKVADLCCFPSKREGLPVALMEAIASGISCLASQIRGNVDLINHINGNLFDLKKSNLALEISDLMDKGINRKKTDFYDMEFFSNKRINAKMIAIYLGDTNG